MEFGTGPLRGWTLTPGARGGREQTARGALLKLIHLADTGDLAQERAILREHGEAIAEALLARRDELCPLLKPTPAEVEALARRAPVEPAPAPSSPEWDAMRAELDEAIDSPQDNRAAVAQPLAGVNDEPSGEGVPLPPLGSPEPTPEEVAANTLRSALLARARELGPNLWRSLVDGGLREEDGTHMCCVCARDVSGRSYRYEEGAREGQLVLVHHAHPLCVQGELYELGRRLEARQAESGPPPGLCPLSAGRWKLAHGARDLPAKPKAYRGADRVGCELCAKAIQAGELSVPKRPGSSKHMHESCRAQVLEHPNQPPTPPTATAKETTDEQT